MSIKIISGNILTNLPTNKDVYICQQVNCRGVMGAGLALKIRRKWPVVYQQYMEIPAWKEFLGSYQKVRVEPNIHVVNLFGQNMREDGSYAPEFFESVDQLETKFQRDVKKTELPTKPDFAKIEELLVEINKSYLHRIM